jgi:hypothetical protein
MIFIRTKLLNIYLPITLILIYCGLSMLKIGALGVQYDEILFGNAASGMIDNSFIDYKIRNIPILLMPYIGALKAYLYYPIFKIFGVSVLSIRLPMVILGALSLWILFEGLKRYFDEIVALTALSIVVFDCSFIDYTRYDVGPNAIEYFCKVLSLLLLKLFLLKRKLKYIGIMFFILGLGLFNKLNFIWYLNAFLISSFLIYFQHFKNILELNNFIENKVLLVTTTISILLYYFYFILLSIRGHLINSISISYIRAKVNNFIEIITGNLFYDYIFGAITEFYKNIYLVAIMALCVIGAIIVHQKSNKIINNVQRESYYLFVSMFLITILQIIITKEANEGWHMFAIYPFFSILYAFSLVTIIRYYFNSYRYLILVLIIISFYQIVNYYNHYIAYDKPVKNIYWAKEIFDLIDYTKHKSNSFVSIDWGTHNQLITFTDIKGKYLELCYRLDEININDKQEKDKIVDIINPDNKRLYIMYSEKDITYDQLIVRWKLYKIADEAGIKFIKIKTITDSNGKPIFNIFTSCID